MSSDGHDSSAASARHEAGLLLNAADVVCELAIDGRILCVSPAVEPVLARTPESLAGRSFIEVVAPEDRAEMLASFQKVVTTGEEPLVRFRALRRDGVRVEFEATIRIFEEDGERRLVTVNCDRSSPTQARSSR